MYDIFYFDIIMHYICTKRKEFCKMPKQKYNRIKAVLAEQERSALWLAEQIGRDKSTVSRWCTNDMQPTIETFYKIAEVLDVDVRELFLKTKD